MSPETVGVIGLILLFILLFAGMPIGLGMAFSGFLGMVYLFSVNGALQQLGMFPFSSVATFALSIVPLYILMGEFAFVSGLAEDAYDAAYKVLGRFPGGLAMGTIGACAGFAACTGSSMAGAALMTNVSLPEMKRYNYDPALSCGSIAAGGTLGILIPPSNAMIFYSLVTEASVGRLFIAGIFPGILLTGLFLLTIYLWVKIRPTMGAPGVKAGWRELISVGKRVWAVALLAGVVLGGIWGGIFSATEAAGIGAFTAFLIAIAKKGFIWKRLIKGLKETAKTTSMIFIILIGATIFSYFMTASNLPATLVELIKGLQLQPIAILVILLIVLIFLGCIMDLTAITFVVLPVFYPVVLALGFDPIWFGIVYVINAEMALITPPIGMNVFVVAGMVKDIPMYTIFKGIAPFFIAMCVGTAIIIIFPQIVLFLPNSMIK